MARYALRITVPFLALQWHFAYAQCVPVGLVVIVNKSNPVESLSLAQLRKLILGDVRDWQDRKNVSFIARDSSTKDFQSSLSASDTTISSRISSLRHQRRITRR